MSNTEWKVKISDSALRTKNPIRGIVDNMKKEPNPEKQLISLSIGDPTVFGNFKTDESCNEAVVDVIHAYKSNGYPHSAGYLAAREAVAKKYSEATVKLTPDDVLLTSGCSHAIHMCIDVLANPGDNILVPCPGFPLYGVVAQYKNVDAKPYRLDPSSSWSVDLQDLEAQIDEKTVAIVVNNPSNPCGSVFTRQHLLDILAVAEKHRLVIIADEIYRNMTFSGYQYVSMASLTSTVPILSVGGIAKQYLVPGWRVGWILIHDHNDVLKDVRYGLLMLSQLILGCNSLIQAALPAILHDTPDNFYKELNVALEKHAVFLEKRLAEAPGLKVVVPQGAMYLMVGLDPAQFHDIEDDQDFAGKLLKEESVFVLPGACFGVKNFFRIVTCPPIEDTLETAVQRIIHFCTVHSQK